MAHIFHSLIDTDRARELASSNISISRTEETVDLDTSLGRIVAEDVISSMNSPPFNRAIKDGFAVRSTDVESSSESNPVKLRIVNTVAIGHPASDKVEPGTCVRIPTGGVMPEGADSVVMVEYTHDEGDSVMIFRPSRRGENMALAGSDTPVGELVIKSGTRIGPRELAVLSSLGVRNIRVYRKIRVGILSTGDELVQPGSELDRGKIYESNGRTIKALMDQQGAIFDARFYGTLPDIEGVMRIKLGQCVSDNDVVIVSGSTSAGDRDMVYRLLGEYDPGIVFHGIKIKPGKPTLLSRNGEKIIIGLPGFPVSAMMTFLTIFFPYLLREAGVPEQENYTDGVLAGKVNLDIGKLNLIPVSVASRESNIAYPIHGGSGSISRLLRADGYISVQGDRRTMEEGEKVRIRLFDTHPPERSLLLVGEPDGVLDTISRQPSGKIRVIKSGHHSALRSMVRNYSDAAGFVHTESTLENLEVPGFGNGGNLVSLWSREGRIGIACRSNSDTKAGDLAGLMASGVPFATINKAEGATRVLERSVSSFGVPKDKFDALAVEVGDFNSVAFTVSEGYYQAGITSAEAAEKYSLDFQPICSFYYHIACVPEMAGEMSMLREAADI